MGLVNSLIVGRRLSKGKHGRIGRLSYPIHLVARPRRRIVRGGISSARRALRRGCAVSPADWRLRRFRSRASIPSPGTGAVRRLCCSWTSTRRTIWTRRFRPTDRWLKSCAAAACQVWQARRSAGSGCSVGASPCPIPSSGWPRGRGPARFSSNIRERRRTSRVGSITTTRITRRSCGDFPAFAKSRLSGRRPPNATRCLASANPRCSATRSCSTPRRRSSPR